MISAKFVPLKYYTLSSQLPCSTVECSGRRILSPGQIAIINTIMRIVYKAKKKKKFPVARPKTIMRDAIYNISFYP